MKRFSSITTDRLVLRPFGDDDEATALRLLTDERVRRFLGGPLNEADATKAVAARRLRTTSRNVGIFGRDTGQAMGEISLERGRGPLLEVSWALLPQFWGVGYGEEAVRAVTGWAFEQCRDDDLIIAVTQTANERSCRLAERLGMTRVGTFQQYGAEQAMYALERPVA